MKMDIDEKLKIGIGTKETEKLKPGKVQVVAIDISPPKNKEGNIIKSTSGKEYDDKVTFICKHPNKEETISISQAKYEKNNKLTEAGIWFHQDEDGLIPKNSVLSSVLRYYKVNSIGDLKGKELETVTDDGGFLCIKAY